MHEKTIGECWEAFVTQVEEAVFEPWATSLMDHGRALMMVVLEEAERSHDVAYPDCLWDGSVHYIRNRIAALKEEGQSED